MNTTTLTIADSSESPPSEKYARRTAASASVARWRIALWGGLAVAVLLPVFMSLGFWQLRKAEAASALQAEIAACALAAPIEIPVTPADAASLRHRRFVLRGSYDAGSQILIDNRVYGERAGYHVVTPLKLDGTAMHVLVNRGWVPAAADRRILPQVPPPTARIEITGVAVMPPARFFTLGDARSPGIVWQNLDFARLRDSLPYPLQPVVLQLDATAPGGYVRDWPRADERALRNLGYAWQWFGFAAASAGIWLYFLLRRR